MSEAPSSASAVAIDEQAFVSHSAARRVLRTLAGFVTSVVLSLFGLTVVTFVIGPVIPIAPVLAVVGDHATRAVYDKARLAMGLDLPVPQQYLIYLNKLFQGDLGTSVITSNPVLADLMHFFPATFELASI